MQSALSHSRGVSQRMGRKTPSSKVERRHGPQDGSEVWGHDDPNPDFVQGWRGLHPPCGVQEQGADPSGNRVFPIDVLFTDHKDPTTAVADLQDRLQRLGYSTGGDPNGSLGIGTTQAIREFQLARGLRVDGLCGFQTWSAIVEAGYHLGDRYLYRKAPMFRGDDVADLQRRLNTLGFDAGRVDGIFGDHTAIALGDFQRNAGIVPDKILGPTTIAELLRMQPRQQEPELVALVRDRERLRSESPTLSGKLIAIAEEGGLGAVIAATSRRLTQAGGRVLALQDPSNSRSAATANAANAHAYLGLRLDPNHDRCTSAFYSGYSYESPGGKRLAQLVQQNVAEAVGARDTGIHGMSLPVLRETRMPAVLCEIGPAEVVVERSAELSASLTRAIQAWVITPCD